MGITEQRCDSQTGKYFRSGIVIRVSPSNPLFGQHDAAGRYPEERFSLFVKTNDEICQIVIGQRLHAVFDIAAADIDNIR